MNPDQTKATERPGRLRLRLSAAAETSVRGGHPWIFGESVRDQNREGSAGEVAVIYDRRDRFLAIGLYDPGSPIRVRVLHTGKPAPVTPEWWAQRFQAALERRRGLFDERTTGYRCINGESDGWPGLVLDRYGDNLVLKLYTVIWLPWVQQVTELCQRAVQTERIVLRLSRNIQELAGQAGLKDGQVLRGTALDGEVVFIENGLRFEADILRGQKTGFFLDQRENRKAFGELAKSRRVLNCFSFSGGFSLYAARGGARSVTDLDISAHALASSERNFALNSGDKRVAQARHELIQANAFDWLEDNTKRLFDLVALDPPSLAKREAERDRAIGAYEKLSLSAISHVAKGGVLVACSCSAHVSEVEFFTSVRRACARSGRRFQEIRTSTHAPDHPATFPEAHYLKAIYLQSE